MSKQQNTQQNNVVNINHPQKQTLNRRGMEYKTEARFAGDCLAGLVAGRLAGELDIAYKWAGSHWSALPMKGKGSLVDAAFKWLLSESSDKADKNTATTCADTAILELRNDAPLPQRDVRRTLIPCNDATLEILPNGTIHAHAPDPTFGLTYAIAATTHAKHGQQYQPQPVPADSLFGRFLARCLPEEDLQSFVQEQAGASLLPRVFSHAAWWVGSGANGKSTLAELVKRFHARSCSLSLHEIGDRFALEKIVGASLFYTDEVSDGKWNEGVFKSLVAGQSLSIERKHRDAVEYKPAAKWLICSNSLPFVRDNSDGVWRRIGVVPFRHTVPEHEQNDMLVDDIFEQEAAIVLDWLLAGAVRVVMRGRMLARHEWPELCVQAITKAKNLDSVEAWRVAQVVECTNRTDTPKAEVFAAYARFCAETGAEPLKESVFWSKLSRKPDFANKLTERKGTVNGKRARLVNVSYDEDHDPAATSTEAPAPAKAEELPGVVWAESDDLFNELASLPTPARCTRSEASSNETRH
ncbi:hypothetical protein GCM10027285_10930 [Oleiagrimonas citrea]|uniref:SF3 helicase domain-containing protein n=1 Tax=Oleiagrimonas citrea TaxID=1665687 RepID=A0A846ZK34_9GAMM|nr:phage/plasmid primase, P4 family [Oleiagrimonas citrea]NKZ38346.1 hypothetical protein [Oleiagrimonas citrea]